MSAKLGELGERVSKLEGQIGIILLIQGATFTAIIGLYFM